MPDEVPEKLFAVRFPESSIVAPEFWIILPVVESNRAIALSVELAGQDTLPPPLPLLALVILPLLSTVILEFV